MRTVAGPRRGVRCREEAPAFDVHVPLMSLPIFERVDIPANCSLHHARSGSEVAKWREWLNDNFGTLRSFHRLIWQGNPAHLHDWRRSLRLDRLRPLLELSAMRFVSSAGRPCCFTDRVRRWHRQRRCADRQHVRRCRGDHWHLDLVICIDSAIAHLAGCDGVRWPRCRSPKAVTGAGRDRDNTPWYTGAPVSASRTSDGAEVVSGRASVVLRPCRCAAVGERIVTAAHRIRSSAMRRSPKPAGQQQAGNWSCEEAVRARSSIDPDHVNTLCNLSALELGSGDGELAPRRCRP